MTYQQALDLKATLPKEVFYKEIWMQIHIVPERDTDFSKFMNYYYANGRNVDDLTAKRFCSNSQYTVHGLSRMDTINWFLTLPNLLNVCNNK